MLRRTLLIWGAGLIAGACSTRVSALTIEIVVDRKWLGENNHASKEFTIDVKEKDGLLDYTITRMAHELKTRLTRLEIRHNGELLAECPVNELAKDRQIRYRFSVSRQATDESVFEIAEYAFVREGEEEILFPGGVIYRIPLGEYLPKGRD